MKKPARKRICLPLFFLTMFLCLPARAQAWNPQPRSPVFLTGLPLTNTVKLLVVRVNCADAETPWSEKELHDTTFSEENSIHAVFKNSSYGKWGVLGDVISVNYPGGKSTLQCRASGRSEWFQANIDPLIHDKGFSVTNYYKVVYVLPPRICVWSGNFDIGQPRIYTTAGDRPRVAAHELAHTFGMQHSATADPFAEQEYGDHSDILGGGPTAPLAQMNAPRAIRFGFIPPSSVQDVLSSGTFSITPLETHPQRAQHKQVLRVLRSGSGPNAEYYYISLRLPVGMDKALAEYTHDEVHSSCYVNRVNIHRFKPDALGYRERMTYLVGLLKDNETFVDAACGVTVHVNSLSGGIACVTLTVNR